MIERSQVAITACLLSAAAVLMPGFSALKASESNFLPWAELRLTTAEVPGVGPVTIVAEVNGDQWRAVRIEAFGERHELDQRQRERLSAFPLSSVHTTYSRGMGFQGRYVVAIRFDKHEWVDAESDGRLLVHSDVVILVDETGLRMDEPRRRVVRSSISSPQRTEVPQSERDALAAFYQATGGANWTRNDGWLDPDVPISRWHGVRVRDGHVVAINLVNNLFSGRLPAELGRLTHLEELVLEGYFPVAGAGFMPFPHASDEPENLTGPIPHDLGKLTKLRRLRLAWHSLTGGLPPELGNLENLEELLLANNRLSGNIPTWLGNLSNLRRLRLHGNEFTGGIPAQLGDLSKLEVLQITINPGLGGIIPPKLGNLTNLQELALHHIELSGRIPIELAQLANLQTLQLQGNRLTGAISPELGGLTRLQRLTLSSNALSGPIPPELGNLTNLDWLPLYNNELTGTIPAELGRLTRLKYLNLERNRLSGEIPSALGNLSDLERINLSDNSLTGPLPVELGRLVNLRQLHVQDNEGLTGRIPAELMNLPLQFLRFDGTNLCEPSDAEFQAWLQQIRFVKSSGLTCED